MLVKQNLYLVELKVIIESLSKTFRAIPDGIPGTNFSHRK